MEKINVSDTSVPLRDKVFDLLRKEILDGKLREGMALTETKLAEELGVSRTPVREAIRKLELQGLIEIMPNKGAVVKGISRQDSEDIYAMRYLLESLATEWAINRITDEELQMMEESIQLLELYAARGDLPQVSTYNTDFHQIIFKAARSKLLHQILSSLQEYVQRVRLESLQTPGRAEEVAKEHYAILEAFKARDVDEAKRLTLEHISKSEANMLRKWQKDKKTPQDD